MYNTNLIDKFDKTKGPKRILSLDGGGIRGILTLGYLERLEKVLRDRYDKPDLVLSDYYDLIGGTSTGAIIASCLAIGKPVKDIIILYNNLGKVVFGKRRYPLIPRKWTTVRSLFKSSYKHSIIEKLLRDNLVDGNKVEIQLGDQQALKCGLAIFAKRADTYSLWTFTNNPDWKYYKSHQNIKLWELCRASSAAPYYFSPKKLRLKKSDNISEFDAAFIDGGVSLANNPVLQIFLAATVPAYGYDWTAGKNEILVTSFGTGNGVNADKVDSIVKRSTLAWASRIPDLFMKDALEMSQVVLQLFGENLGDPEIINHDYGDLKTVRFSSNKLFSFCRFNVKMTSESLTNELGIPKTEEEVMSLVQMDHFENMEELLKIGRKAAMKLKSNHIAECFC
jgi:patatin-like phospholipase/acyl hydrolase